MNCGRFNKGQVSLPVILLISSIIIEIAIAGSFVAYFLSAGGLGERLAARARTTALSGIYDAMIKITRDKEFGNGNCSPGGSYEFNVGSDKATMNICKTEDDPSNSYIYTIMALATASSRQKKFIGIITVDQTNGRVKLKSITEEPVS